MEGSLALTPRRLSHVFIMMSFCVRLSSEVTRGVEGGPPWRGALPALPGDSAMCLPAMLFLDTGKIRSMHTQISRHALRRGHAQQDVTLYGKKRGKK